MKKIIFILTFAILLPLAFSYPQNIESNSQKFVTPEPGYVCLICKKCCKENFEEEVEEEEEVEAVV